MQIQIFHEKLLRETNNLQTKVRQTFVFYLCNIKQYKMDFLSPPLKQHEQPHLLNNAAIANEIFLKSLNTSYIGRMSGQKQLYHKIQYEPHKIQQINTPKKKKRIDFSRLRGQTKSQIKQTVISDEDMQYMFIRNFSKGKEELTVQDGCSNFCHSNDQKYKCLLEMVNQSTLQLHLKDDRGQFKQLFVSINFDTVSTQIQFEHIPQNKQIAIFIGPYKLLLEHDKRKVVDYWYGQISKMHSQSKGKEFPLKKILQNNEFYKERMQTQQFFMKNCDTGDIILFQDNHFFAKAQRFFTRSNFDHVGMMIKDTNHGLLIFQSNSSSGVCLTPWRYVIRYGWYKTIPKIAWRRLKVNRNKQFNEKIQKFIIQNLKRNYNISFAKLTAHQSVLRQAGNGQKNIQFDPKDEQSGFFCSELVATAYKQLGLITRNKQSQNYQPACKFYPKDFTEASQRKLDRGQLSPQYTIYFDDTLLKLTYRNLIRDS